MDISSEKNVILTNFISLETTKLQDDVFVTDFLCLNLCKYGKGLFTPNKFEPVTEIQPNMLMCVKNNRSKLLSVNTTVGWNKTHFLLG